MNKILLATSALAVSGFVASEATAVSVELYGQVNKALLAVDDGENTEFTIVDNEISSTRIGLKGSQVLDNGLTASVLLETEIRDNASDEVSQTGTNANNISNRNEASFVSRHARVGLAGDFGAVFIGRQSTATDSVTEQDLVGVQDFLYSGGAEDLVGSYQFRSEADGSLTGNTVELDNFDGADRQNAVRYDSPIYNGFQGRASVQQGGDTDFALYYAGRYDAFQVNAAIGHVFITDDQNVAGVNTRLESQTSGSISAKHDSGIAATVAYGIQSLENEVGSQDDPTFGYVKVGYEWDAFEVAADYTTSEDVLVAGSTAETENDSFGIGAQYNLGNGVSVAATYRTIAGEVDGTDQEDLDIYGVNLRVKF